MSEKINLKNEGDADVMQIIDFSALETADHEDDMSQWNSMEPYGEDDAAEAEWKNTRNINQKELKRILSAAKAGKVGQRALEVLVA